MKIQKLGVLFICLIIIWKMIYSKRQFLTKNYTSYKNNKSQNNLKIKIEDYNTLQSSNFTPNIK